MPRKAKAPLPQPLFGEPVFNENGAPTPDPTTFRTTHDANKDKQLYNQVQNLLTKDTVKFNTARGNPGDVFTLASALGSQGPADVQTIQKDGQIVFHATGDSGASSLGKLGHELSVADHLTNDFHTSTGADRPAPPAPTAPLFFFIWVISSTTSVNPSITTTSFTSLSATTQRRSSPFPATTTRS